MQHNLQNALYCQQLDESCFILPSVDDVLSLRGKSILNPHDCATEMVNTMLENYFLHPRYLHTNDVIKIDAKEYAQDLIYSSGDPAAPTMYFAVKSLRLHHDKHTNSVNSCYVVRGETALVQEAQVHSYNPRKRVLSFSDNVFLPRDGKKMRGLLNGKCPPALEEFLERIETCIRPFLKEGKLYSLIA